MSGFSTRWGLPAIVTATGVAGVAGYVVTWLAFHSVGAAGYAVFAVFWSATYLIVGALGGLQQEVTRGTHPRAADESPGPPTARNFAIAVALVVVAVVVAFTPVWTTLVFPEAGGAWLILPLAVGTGSYVIVAVVAGTLFGVQAWWPVAWMIALDGLLRLALAIGVALVAPDPLALAWAVALPFPLAVVIVWLVVRRRVVGHTRLDVGMRPLVWNASRTVVAAASTSILVSGFPLALKLSSPGEDAVRLGVLILAITLVRAPLIVVGMSVQSYLLVMFRPPHSLLRRGVVVGLAVVAAGGLLAAIGALIGPWFFQTFFGEVAVVEGQFIAILVASSALIAGMMVSGAALLSRSAHFAYTAGWIVAAVLTIGLLLVPIELEARIALSSLAGPAGGLAVHAAGLFMLQARATEAGQR